MHPHTNRTLTQPITGKKKKKPIQERNEKKNHNAPTQEKKKKEKEKTHQNKNELTPHIEDKNTEKVKKLKFQDSQQKGTKKTHLDTTNIVCIRHSYKTIYTQIN